MLLRNKLFYSIIILIIIPSLIVSIIVRVIFLESKIEEITHNTEQVLVQSNKNLDLLIEDASRTSLAILYDRKILDVLRKYDSKDGHIPSLRDREAFSSLLASIMYKRDSIYGVHVFSNNGFVFSHASKQMNMTKFQFEKEDWFKETKVHSGSGIIYPSEKPSYYIHEVDNMVSFARIIRDPIDHKELGVIKLDFQPNIFNEQTESKGLADWEISLDGRPLVQRENNELMNMCQENNNWVKDEATGVEYMCVVNKSEQTGVAYRNLIPKSYIYKEIQEFDKILIIMTFIIILFSLAISYYVSRRLMDPLEKLKRQAVQMHNEFKGYQFNEKEKGDIVILSGLYNQMFEEIEILFKQLYHLQFINAEAEYRALQAKMNPHFIFNTLESINMIAIKNNQLELSDKIVELGKLIRYNLKNDEVFVKLKEEINFTKTYISIMKSRMTEKVDVNWFIDRDLMNDEVPKYIIQPIVENAFNHGFAGKEMMIHIQIQNKGNAMVIEVSDDGTGISNEKLSAIYKWLNLNLESRMKMKSDSNGIALNNIKERLSLTYGMEGKLIIESVEGNGTVVTIIIPRRENE